MIWPSQEMEVKNSPLLLLHPGLSHNKLPESIILAGLFPDVLNSQVSVNLTLLQIRPVSRTLVLVSFNLFGRHDQDLCIFLPNHVPLVSSGSGQASLGSNVPLEVARLLSSSFMIDVVRVDVVRSFY